jgi:hypothetical protein
MIDDNHNATLGDLAAVADASETTGPHFEAMLGQGERTISDRLVGISQATIEDRVARLEELDPAITDIVQMLRHRLDELEERVAVLEAAKGHPKRMRRGTRAARQQRLEPAITPGFATSESRRCGVISTLPRHCASAGPSSSPIPPSTIFTATATICACAIEGHKSLLRYVCARLDR